MKKIILARHGETDHNNERIFQSDNSNLNDIGRQQVESLANDLAAGEMEVDVILHSPLYRAVESADILSRRLDKPTEALDLLVEFMNPPVIRGRSYDDPVADRQYRSWLNKLQLEQSLDNPDVENYFDLYQRSGKILAELSSRSEDIILVVSHSEIIRTVVLRTLLGVHVKSEQIAYSIKNLKLQNARTVTLLYDEQKDLWRVLL